jgi:dolichol-phosphate mannosyltransferase
MPDPMRVPGRVVAAAIAYNERAKIGRVLDRFGPGAVDEIVVVDDGSTDGTGDIARQKGATVLTHVRRRGAGAAIRTAIDYGLFAGFDVLVVLAGNDKDRPAEIPRLVRPLFFEGYDLVQGSRYLPGGSFGNMPFYRRLATQFMHPMLFSMLAGQHMTDTTNGFRALRLAVLADSRLDLTQAWLDQYELEPYLLYKMIKLGYKVKEAPVTKVYPPHELGYTKMRPIIGWWSILRPLALLGLGLKK